MKSRFQKHFLFAILLATAGLFNISYAETPGGEEIPESSIPSASKPVSMVADYLVNAAGEQVDGAALAEKQYVLFYYSAHWCPPCRLFTPKLVDFYNTHNGGEAFEIVFVSADRSEKKMFRYMRELKMPWLAVRYDDIGVSRIESYASQYIPYLVMFDQEGNVIEGTDGKPFMRPGSVLKELSNRL